MGGGRPKTGPREVTGDRAYDAKGIRTCPKRKRIKANVPVIPRNRRKLGREDHAGLTGRFISV